MAFPTGDSRSWQHHKGQVLVTVDGYDAIACEPCEFIHVVPIPTSDELREYYATQFYSNSKPDYLEGAARDREWLNIGYDAKFDMLDEAAGQSAKGRDRRRRILDIGSGPGHFLLRAKERGWDGVGIETAPEAVEFAGSLGLEVHQGYFDGTDEWTLGTFDAIHMRHVLEHVPDPHHFLSSIKGLLRPGGSLCIEVPNDFSIIQEILFVGMDFPAWWVAPPEHLNYFSKDSLESLLQSHGHNPLSWTSEFPVDLLLLAGVDYVRNPHLGAAMHAHRKSAELAIQEFGEPTLLRDLYSALIENGLGRQLTVVTELRRG